MTTKTASHRSIQARHESIQWDDASPLTMSVETRRGTIETRHGRFVGGPSDQVEVIEVDTGAVHATILPSRGMSIWTLEAGGIRFGWNSPVAGPIHPGLVPVFDPSGIGWLEGFDELVVRCGLESNGSAANTMIRDICGIRCMDGLEICLPLPCRSNTTRHPGGWR